MSHLFLIAGLGNPGRKYKKTRHNVGFMAIDEMAGQGHCGFKSQNHAEVADLTVGDKTAYLIKPLTFMNESGLAVRSIKTYYNIDPENIMVIHDDIDLPVGQLRIRTKGGSGGHKGIKSIINHLGTNGFARLRIGIKPNHPVQDVVRFVLSTFSRTEKKIIADAIDNAVSALNLFITDGVEKSMNLYNTPKTDN